VVVNGARAGELYSKYTYYYSRYSYAYRSPEEAEPQGEEPSEAKQ
jgi:hypothetical protein